MFVKTSRIAAIAAAIIAAMMMCAMSAPLAFADETTTEPEVAEEGVFKLLGESTYTLSVGGTAILQYDDSQYDDWYYFESSNENVATVNNSGKVKGKNLGVATVSAMTDEDVLASWKICVTKKSLTVKEPVGCQWNFGVTLANVSGWKSGTYKSSNKKICSVKGRTITTHKSGNVTITAKIKGVTYTIKVKSVAVPVATLKAKTESYIKNHLYYPSSYQRISLTYKNGQAILRFSANNQYGTRIASIAYGFYSGNKFYVSSESLR